VRAAVATGLRTLPRAADLLRSGALALRRGVRAPSARVRRRVLALILVMLALAAAYMLWFRDSSFVRVQHVTVTGLTGVDATRERAMLVAAAKRMTTLHVNEDALRRALGAGATVEAVRVSTDFPHGLHIEVFEKAAVAVLQYGSERVAVGSGGVLLPDVRPIPRALPAIAVGALPSGGRLGHGRARRLVAAAAAAPTAVRNRLLRLRELPAKGLVAYLRNGPEVILGDATELRAKWTAAAAILADPMSRGASYIDVRLPDRPVAGGLDIAPPPPADQPTAPPGQALQPGAATTPGAAASPAAGAAPTGQAPATTAGQAATPPAGQTATPAPAAPAQGTATGGTATGGGP
jgi:cell division protein FtsQ